MREKILNKDKDFRDIMAKPDAAEQSEVWAELMQLAAHLEDERGFSRQTVCEGLLRATLDLAKRRPDERYFQKFNDVRYFLLWAAEYTKRKLDNYVSYRTQRAIEERHGKDSLAMRDAKNFGWQDDIKTKH